jgi:AcrR family transcriptional regulator
VSDNDAGVDDRREQMLRAAMDVIAERGFPDTRIADVGRRVGASSALVIYYFGTKDRLLTEALRYSEDLFYADVALRLESIPGARDKLEALVRMSCASDPPDGLAGSWMLWPDLWAQALRHPEVKRDREQLDQRWREKVAEIVRAGVDSGEFAPVDVEEFSLMVTALLDGLVVQVTLGDPIVSSERAISITMRTAARELGYEWHGSAGRSRGGRGRASRPRVRRAAGGERLAAGGR